MNAKRKFWCALVAVFAVAAIGLAQLPAGTGFSAQAEETIAYRLEFADEDNLGKNTGDPSYPDAEVYRTETNGLTQTEGPRAASKAVQFPESAPEPYSNYLSLPTSVFDGAEKVTIAGWFRVPSNIGAWVCELCIQSPETTKGFRVDPYAPNARNGILWAYGNNVLVDDNMGDGAVVKPVYDAWRHVAYVAEAGKVSIYQNGSLVKVIEDASMTPDLWHSENSKFYLGQNVWEAGHPDYNGAMSDVRVYRSALTEEQIEEEYQLNYRDFLTTEYTFDEDDLYRENIRGYDAVSLKPHDFSGVTTDPYAVSEGTGKVLRLDGTSAFVLARNENGTQINTKLLAGHSRMSLSMDIRLNGALATDTGWERIWDIIVDKNSEQTGYITAMAHREPGSGTELIYGNNSTASRWLFSEAGVNTVLAEDEWINLTWVFGADSVRAYLNGVCVMQSDGVEAFRRFSDVVGDMDAASSFFTLGSPVHEASRRLAADYDNVRIWACELTQSEVAEVMSENETVRDKIVTITLDGVPHKAVSGQPFTLPTEGEYGYRLVGWYEDESWSGEPADAVIIPTTDSTYYSKWEKATYTITYRLPEGAVNPNTVSEYTVDSAEIVFSDAALEGYRFEGWFTGERRIERIPQGADVGGDLILEAKFTPVEYQVIYHADGASHENPAAYTVETAGALLDAEKEGYSFEGWYDAETGGERVLSLEGHMGDLELWARFSEITYQLTLPAPAEEGTWKVTAGEKELSGSGAVAWSDREIALTVSVSRPDLYAVTVSLNGNALTADEDGVYRFTLTGDSELKIAFIPKGYSLTLEYDEKHISVNVGGESYAPGTYPFPAEFSGTAEVSCVEGRYLSEIVLDGTPIPTEYGKNNVSLSVILANDAALSVLSAELNRYTVKFDANGGKGTAEDLQLLWSEAAELPSEAFYRIGYRLAGWTDESGAEYLPDAQIAGLTQEENAAVTLTAAWEANSYTVGFDCNGGEGSFAPIAAVYDAPFALPQEKPSKEGYTFIGWSLTEHGAANHAAGDTAGNLTPVDGDTITLFAVWERNLYKVTLIAGGATVAETLIAYRTGVAFSDLVSGAQVGAIAGWAETENGNVAYKTDDILYVRGDVTLYAVPLAESESSASGSSVSEQTTGAEGNGSVAVWATVGAVCAIGAIAIVIYCCRRNKARY